MSTKKKDSNNKKTEKIEKKIIDKKTFVRIDTKFHEYWKYLFSLISIYIISYLVWRFILAELVSANTEWWMILIVALIQGTLFCLDGWVTALLKSPFNQMCYTINRAEGIDDKKKDYIITKATESNEHCKETLKKFGILTITGELLRVFIKGQNPGDPDIGKWEPLLFISYFIPLLFAALDIWLINKELKKFRKLLNSSHGK